MKHTRKPRPQSILLTCLLLCLGTGTQALAANRKKSSKPKQETSATLKRQEQDVNREIKLTQSQIEENEAAVRENLSILTGLEHEINLQKRKVEDLRARQGQIQDDMAACRRDMAACQDKLSTLRARYVASVKKMRLARKKATPLAYIFASKSFYQAWRRMRYLRKFNDWRERREQEIKGEIARLEALGQRLATGERQLQANLAQQRQAQQVLADKHAAQDVAVKNLRAHGDALRAHLANKQAEANALSAKVTAIIAAEQEQARLAEQRRQEAKAKARAKAQAEAQARKKAEAEAKAKAEAEAKAKAEAERKAAQEKEKEKEKERQKQKQKQKQKEKEKQKPKEKQTKKKDKNKAASGDTKEQPKQTDPAKDTESKTYAEARGRKPRGNSQASPATDTSATLSKSPSATISTGFAAAKGTLPRPVDGQFSIVSRFGPHPLPDLPDVMFDNPGIDAVVSSGASALAVYPGTVTGVYVLPGFSTVVIVSHGEYYTVYGNIGTPAVAKGQTVKQGQALGKLVADPDEGGRTTIHFEIYKNRDKLNPEAWIR